MLGVELQLLPQKVMAQEVKLVIPIHHQLKASAIQREHLLLAGERFVTFQWKCLLTLGQFLH